MTVATITPQALNERLRDGRTIELIDVRTPVEFREVHVTFARNVPLDQLDPQTLTKSRSGSAAEPLYVICRSGSRAEQACKKLVASGCTDVVSVAGGTVAWDQAGLPVVRGRKAVSLERQVRIVAGFLVLTGAVLALTISPWFALLPAFVGSGLAFSGITDTCGMGMLLAKLPWNQVRDCPSQQQRCPR